MRPSLPLEVVHSVRLSTWHSLFAALGYPSGLSSSCASLDEVADALWSSEVPLPLARALFFLSAFTTEAGRTDVYNAAAALDYATRWPGAESPADLVAVLLAAAPTDAAVAELLEAAKVLRDRAFRSLSTLTYVGAREVAIAPGGPPAHAKALRARASAWTRSRDFGRVLPVRFTSDAGAVHFEITHEDRTEVVVSAPPGAGEAGESDADRTAANVRTTHRPLRSHLLTIEDGGRRLWIATDCLEMATPLAAIAGEVLFGDARYFLEVAGVDLWRMQEQGAAALSAPELVLKLLVQAVGGSWLSGKAHVIAQHGRDFFKALERYKIRIEGGRLVLATLRATIHTTAGGPSTCDVAIRPPHQVTVSEPEHAPLLRRFLDLARITRPAPRPRDFISMQPWIDTREEWIAEEGEAGFAWLLERGILRPDRTNRAVASPLHPYAGRTATAHALRGSRFIAWSVDATIAPFVVDEKDLVVYALSFAHLARTIASALGLEGPAEKLDDDGVLYCGRRALATTHALVFLPTRPMRPATVARLREAAEHGHAALIASGRMREQGLREIPMPKLAGPWHPLLGALVRALHVEAFVDTTLYAPPGARVVLHRSTLRVWLDGVACTLVTELQFRLLEILVVHAGQPLHTKEIAAHITHGNFHEDTTRRALEGLMTALEKSFKAQKKKAPKDLGELIEMPRRGYYALRVAGFVD